MLTFGDLVDKLGKYIPGITHYEVAFVDKEGRKLKPLAMIATDKDNVTCCDQAKYKAAVRFNVSEINSELKWRYPNGYNGIADPMRLAVTARSTFIYLPYLAFTDPIIDTVDGQLKKIEGELLAMMQPVDAFALAKHPRGKRALSRAYALTLLLSEDNVFTTAIYIADERAARRLEKSATQPVDYTVRDQRRLLCCPTTSWNFCGGTPCDVAVRIAFEIWTSPGDTKTAEVIRASTNLFLYQLRVAIERETAAVGVPITITEQLSLFEAKEAVIGTPSGNEFWQSTTPVPPSTVAVVKQNRASAICFPSMAVFISIGFHLVLSAAAPAA